MFGGLGFGGLGVFTLRVWDSGFRGLGSGLVVLGLGIQGLGFGFEARGLLKDSEAIQLDARWTPPPRNRD